MAKAKKKSQKELAAEKTKRDNTAAKLEAKRKESIQAIIDRQTAALKKITDGSEK